MSKNWQRNNGKIEAVKCGSFRRQSLASVDSVVCDLHGILEASLFKNTLWSRKVETVAILVLKTFPLQARGEGEGEGEFRRKPVFRISKTAGKK